MKEKSKVKSQKSKLSSASRGFYLPLILVFATVMIIIVGGILSLTFSNYSLVRQKADSNSALNIAEAGVNYYLWHLSHSPQDYCDGASCSGNGQHGPYVHTYFDAAGNANGSYSLLITPPVTSSAVVTVKSTGTSSNGQNRTIQATLGIPSFAQYSFVTNSETWLKSGMSLPGPVHSNNGVHFDATAGAVVSATAQSYTPADCFGGDNHTAQAGVWGSGGPASYWNFPVPQINFNQITNNLSLLQANAQAAGMFLPTLVNNKNKKTFSGYALQFNADGTVLVGNVTGGQDAGGIANGCGAHNSYTSLMQTVQWESSARAMPANGIIFAADNVWLWGTITVPLTVASARLPDTASTNTNVFLQDDINYSTHDGSVSLGVISQSDIVINSASANNLNVDAFLLSQNGRVFRPLYAGNTKNSLSLYGGVGSNSWWAWNWTSGATVTSGYQNLNLTYDSYLALSPPPLFPQTGSFAILSWREEPIL